MRKQGTTVNFCFKLLECIYRMGIKAKSTKGSQITYGCFLKWWYPQNTAKWSFFVGNPWLLGKPTILDNTHILVGRKTAKVWPFLPWFRPENLCMLCWGVAWNFMTPFWRKQNRGRFFCWRSFLSNRSFATAQFRLFSARTGTSPIWFGTGWWHLKNWYRGLGSTSYPFSYPQTN